MTILHTIKKLAIDRKALGCALVLVGVPIGMYMNFFVSVNQWSNIIMALGTFLIIDYRNLLRLKAPSWNKAFTFLFIYQIICILYFHVSEIPEFAVKYKFFHFFVISLIFALASNSRKGLDLDNVMMYSWLLSLSCAILSFFVILVFGFVMSYSDTITHTSNDTEILEKFTMANACVVNIATSLYISKRNTLLMFFFIAVIVFDLYMIVLIGKRTPIIVSMLIIGLYLYKNHLLHKLFSFKTFLIMCLILVSLRIVFFQNEVVNEQLNRFFEQTWLGLSDMFFGTDLSGSSAGGNSAIARYAARKYAFDYISSNFNIINYILGDGYMVRWLDNPLLQSYLDMGLFGFCTYLVFVIIFPIKCSLATSVKKPMILFACSLCFYNVFSALNSGNPYIYSKWIPVCLLIYILSTYNNQVNKRNPR